MQHGFTKGRPCQTDSISFREKVTKNIAREVFPERGGSIHVFVWGPGGTLHTILLTCISGRYLPAGWDAERSAGRLGKWIWEAWLLSLMGMLARDVAMSQAPWREESHLKDNTGTERVHTEWSRVDLVCKENWLQKQCSSGKGFQEKLWDRKLIAFQGEPWIF